jgi:hypothetical protein
VEVVLAVTGHRGRILEQDNQEQQTGVVVVVQVHQAVVLVDLTALLVDQVVQVLLSCVT